MAKLKENKNNFLQRVRRKSVWLNTNFLQLMQCTTMSAGAKTARIIARKAAGIPASLYTHSFNGASCH